MSSSVTVADESSDHHDRPSEDIALVDGLPENIARTLANSKDDEVGERFNRGASNKPEEKHKLESARDETNKKGHLVILQFLCFTCYILILLEGDHN